MNFCRNRVRDWQPQINDIEDFLAKQTRAGQGRWETYYQEFLAAHKTQPQGLTVLEEFEAELEERRSRANAAWERSQAARKESL